MRNGDCGRDGCFTNWLSAFLRVNSTRGSAVCIYREISNQIDHIYTTPTPQLRFLVFTSYVHRDAHSPRVGVQTPSRIWGVTF